MTNEPADEKPAARVAPEVTIADVILPNQTNYYQTMFGGEVMALMDKAAAIAALRFCRQPIVTASSEQIDFRTPIHVSEIIEAVARVIFAGTTSMIVRVHVFGEHPLSGDRRLCTTGYFSMVTVNESGQHTPVPQLALADDEARAEWEVGAAIRNSISARRAAQRNEPK